MKQFLKYALPAFLLISIITACEKQYETIDSIDSKNVTSYIQANKLNVTEYEKTGVFYEIIQPGSGEDLEYSDQVPLVLTIKSLDGKYTSLDTFRSGNRYYDYLGYFNLEGVRVGVKEALKKPSGLIRMIIPSRLAFGRNGYGDIPGNASLDITIRALDKSKMGAYDDASILNYIKLNNLAGFTKTSSGMYYKIGDAGSGSPITLDSTVVAEYTGKYFNGIVFDRTAVGAGATFDLNGDINPSSEPIEGWKEALPLIKQGGSIRILLPSALAYGLAGTQSGIPPFSCMDFEIKVTDVKQQ
jgi:FKBP-type peptidyl-prolyl cis-trans isomerase FkpA